jgi:hypothetical protein
MEHLTRVEYCPGDGTRYNLLIGKARISERAELGLFVAKMDYNTGTSAIFPDGDFNHWTYVAEKLRCGEIAARAIAHFLNLRFFEPYKAQLKQHIGGIEGCFKKVLPPCFITRWDDENVVYHRTIDEILDIALSITHGVTYADILYTGPYGVGEHTPVPLYMGPFGVQEHPPEECNPKEEPSNNTPKEE